MTTGDLRAVPRYSTDALRIAEGSDDTALAVVLRYPVGFAQFILGNLHEGPVAAQAVLDDVGP